MPDYRYTQKEFETELGPCVYSVEGLDLTEYGLPGLSFTGDLHIEIDNSCGEDEWYIEFATADIGNNQYQTYRYAGGRPIEQNIYKAIEKAVVADQHLCDCIRDLCKESA